MPFASDVLGAPAKPRKSTLDTIFRPLAKRLQDDHMSKLGIATTMRLARDYNWINISPAACLAPPALPRAIRGYMLAENGGLTRPRIELKDGYAIDTSMSFPHLDRILDVSEEINQGALRRRPPPIPQFLPEHLDRGVCPPVPGLPRLRHVERHPGAGGRHAAKRPDHVDDGAAGDSLRSKSSEAFDTDPTRPKDSQLYHIDLIRCQSVCDRAAADRA